MKNEIQRILESRSDYFTESFLESEKRNNFYVDAQRKKIWLIGMDLLLKFDEVCNKYGLTYCIAYGTLIGAIRHKGFIPWDDDIDIWMLRKDYELLQKHADDFEYPYFLQTPLTDPQCLYSWIRLRNSNTTAISKNHCFQNFNFGINIDIICLDDWDLNNGRDRFNKIVSLAVDNSNYMYKSNPNPDSKQLARISAYSGNDPHENLKKIYELGTQCREPSDYLCTSSMTILGYDKSVFFKEDFIENKRVEFENITVPIPIGYDRILRTIYGDYMEFPPKIMDEDSHEGIIIDPDISYVEWKNNNLKY